MNKSIIDLIKENNYDEINKYKDHFDYSIIDAFGKSAFSHACTLKNINIIELFLPYLSLKKEEMLLICKDNVDENTFNIFKLLKSKNILKKDHFDDPLIFIYLIDNNSNDEYISKIFDIILPYISKCNVWKYDLLWKQRCFKTIYKRNLILTFGIFLKYIKYEHFTDNNILEITISPIFFFNRVDILNILLHYLYTNNNNTIRNKHKMIKNCCKYSTDINMVYIFLNYYNIDCDDDYNYLKYISNHQKLNKTFQNIIKLFIESDYLLK